MSHRALARIDFGKPDEPRSIFGGAVFDPSEVDLPPDEVKRLMDRGLLEESDLPLWDNPMRPVLGSSTVTGPLTDAKPRPLTLPTHVEAPAQPAGFDKGHVEERAGKGKKE